MRKFKEGDVYEYTGQGKYDATIWLFGDGDFLSIHSFKEGVYREKGYAIDPCYIAVGDKVDRGRMKLLYNMGDDDA